MYLKKLLVTALAGSVSLVSLSASALINLGDINGGKWSAFVEGDYLYQNNVLPPYARLAPEGNKVDFPTEYNWGWGVGIGYTFLDAVHDVQFSYDNLTTDNSQTKFIDRSYSFPSMPTPGASGAGDGTGNLHINDQFNFDSYDLTIGLLHNFTDNLSTRLGVGASYIDLRQSGEVAPFYNGVNESFFINDFQKVKSTFYGVGPLVTGNARYAFSDWLPGLSIIGGIGAAMYFGEAKTSTNAYTSGLECGCTIDKSQTDADESETRVAFGLEGNAGLRYDHALTSGSTFNIEIGYKGTNIVNAFRDGNAGYPAFSDNLLNEFSNYEYGDNYYNYGAYLTVGVAFL